METNLEIEMSPLGQELTHGGKSVRVDIYRGDTGGWILEIVYEFDNSIVWDVELDTAALGEVKSTIQKEDIDSLIGIEW